MAALMTTATLAKWTQNDPEEVAADPFAVDLLEKLSALVCFIAGRDGTKVRADGEIVEEWGLAGPVVPPIDVQMVMLQVAKRSYENPEQVIQQGNIGPLGGNRVSDTQALFMDFTESERATLVAYNVDGDPTGNVGAAQIYTIGIVTESTLQQDSPLYAADNQQVGLAESADPRPWRIPLFNPGDPGDSNNYA